jgi:NADH-quinone oxidoreductase subunit L
MTSSSLVRWIVFAPLAGFIINFLFSRFIKKYLVSIIASLAVLLSFVFSCILFFRLKAMPSDTAISDVVFNWMNITNLNINIAFVLDRLSAIMSLVVSGVSFLIHIYSIGYMDDDSDFKRFFSYLNLFVFFMLVLVLANNILLLFVGWEGVGLCSYLLIGFWYENINNSKAGKKAFITNRVGDAFFIAGMVVIYYILSSNGFYNLDFNTINSNVSLFYNTSIFGVSSLTLIAILLFIGATGKSAQFPLYVWLPDAMAGPTPVSALIHAATMVTAGVYLVARLIPVYSASVSALNFILYISAFTAIFSAIIAITQRDIKKILAYSTISQLGYMFMGVAGGIYIGGIFHLVTHAFFKALMFLSAGAVIHALSNEQDIFNMGSLNKKLKNIFIVMGVGWLSISGFPFLSGYFSKDFIIENLYLSGHKGIWLVAVVTAFLTAFYMTRMFNIAFIKESKKELHPHRPTSVMTIPLYILAILAIISGFFINGFISFAGVNRTEEFLPLTVKYTPVVLSLLGIICGFVLTADRISDFLSTSLSWLHKIVYDKFYVDEIYDFLIIRPLGWISKTTFNIIDRVIIDRTLVEGTARAFYQGGRVSAISQNGNAQIYAVYMLFGTAIILLVYLSSVPLLNLIYWIYSNIVFAFTEIMKYI